MTSNRDEHGIAVAVAVSGLVKDYLKVYRKDEEFSPSILRIEMINAVSAGLLRALANAGLVVPDMTSEVTNIMGILTKRIEEEKPPEFVKAGSVTSGKWDDLFTVFRGREDDVKVVTDQLNKIADGVFDGFLKEFNYLMTTTNPDLDQSFSTLIAKACIAGHLLGLTSAVNKLYDVRKPAVQTDMMEILKDMIDRVAMMGDQNDE